MGRLLNEDDVIRVMCQRIVGVSEERARIVASYIPSAEPSASDCWKCNCPRMSNDNRPTDEFIDTKSSRYGTDRTMDGLISRAEAISACINDDGGFGYGDDIIIRLEGLPSAQPEVTSNNDCNGCKFVGCYDTDFPCANCIRKNKDYYDPERRTDDER